jgi:hypothetical protein
MDNIIFATTNIIFQKACDLARVKPTRRQASKYRAKKGSAFKKIRAAIDELTREAP